MAKQIIAISSVVLALAMLFLAVDRKQSKHEEILPSANIRQQLAEQLWANACWHALFTFEDETQEEKMAECFINAIELTEEKAPIYVAYGVFDSGVFRLADQFESLILSALLEHDVAEINKEGQHSEKSLAIKFEQLVRRSLSKALTGNSLRGHLDEIQNLMWNGTHLSEICFQAAIAEDPQYLPAWYYLAHATEGEKKRKVLKEWSIPEPNNALPKFLLANELWKPQYKKVEKPQDKKLVHVGEGYEEAIQMVKAGIDCEYFQVHSQDWPTTDPQHSWNDSPTLLNAISQRLPDVKLEETQTTTQGVKNLHVLFDEIYSFLDPDARSLRNLSSKLHDAAEFHFHSGRIEKAKELKDLQLLLGKKILNQRSCSPLLKINGYSMMFQAVQPINSGATTTQLNFDIENEYQLRIAIERFKIFLKLASEYQRTSLPDLISGKSDWQTQLQALDAHLLRHPPKFFVEIPTQYGSPPARP